MLSNLVKQRISELITKQIQLMDDVEREKAKCVTTSCGYIHGGEKLARIKKQLYSVETAIGHNKKKAAEVLGLSRKALYNKLKRYEIDLPEQD